MKKQNGVTLVSLALYIIVMCIVLVLITSIINEFYNNTTSMQADTQEMLEFNNFNMYFLKEVKKKGNKVDSIVDKDYILFTSGDSFSYSNNKIYYNDIAICKEVKELEIKFKQDEDGNNIEDVIYVKVTFNNFSKSINYKIEEMY